MTAKLPYTENFNLMDGRLVICAVAVGVAMFALLWDFLNPFPKSRPVLIGCVASYFLLMGVLTLYTTFKVISTVLDYFFNLQNFRRREFSSSSCRRIRQDWTLTPNGKQLPT